MAREGQLPTKGVLVVDGDNAAAASLMRKLCANAPLRAGQVIFVTHEEFEALRDSAIILDLPLDVSEKP